MAPLQNKNEDIFFFGLRNVHHSSFCLVATSIRDLVNWKFPEEVMEKMPRALARTDLHVVYDTSLSWVAKPVR